jgi:hypothetical protein
VIFSHVLLAATGLVVWVLYLYLRQTRFAWAAFFILLPVAILGFIMLTRWIPVHRAANAGAAMAAHRIWPARRRPGGPARAELSRAGRGRPRRLRRRHGRPGNAHCVRSHQRLTGPAGNQEPTLT